MGCNYKFFIDAAEKLRKNKSNRDLLGRELDTLLLWNWVPKSKWGDQKNGKVGGAKGKETSFFGPWTDTEEVKLMEMEKKVFKVND